MNIKTSTDLITLCVWDNEDGKCGFNYQLSEHILEMYFSLPGVQATQEIQHRGIQIEVEYDVYTKIGPRKYEELMRETHKKIVEMDELFTRNQQDYKDL